MQKDFEEEQEKTRKKEEEVLKCAVSASHDWINFLN